MQLIRTVRGQAAFLKGSLTMKQEMTELLHVGHRLLGGDSS